MFTDAQRAKAADTRRRKSADRKAQSSGIGESRPFIAPEGVFPAKDLSECHVGGQLVSSFPPEVQVRILYAQTDEGIAEAARGKPEPAAPVRILSDPLDKSIQERRDFRENNLEAWEAPDPMKELADKHCQPGMRPKFLSQTNVNHGKTGGFQPVIDEKGNPVRLGTMILGQMPEERAVRRGEHYQEKSAAQLAETLSQTKEEQERYIRDSGMSPSALRSRHPDEDTGLHSTRGNTT